MTIKRENLPGGGWADLRDVAEIPERLHRPIRAIQMKLAKDPAFTSVIKAAEDKGIKAVKDLAETDAAAMVAQMSDESAALLDDLNDRAVMARVIGWSYEPAVSLDALLELPVAVYNRLKEVCAENVLSGGLDASPSQDEESPTVPSTA